jgi:hypothetical protein
MTLAAHSRTDSAVGESDNEGYEFRDSQMRMDAIAGNLLPQADCTRNSRPMQAHEIVKVKVAC